MRQPMYKNRVLHKKRKTVLVVVLLAALCIGAAELIACRIADPLLYYEVTQPVRVCARQAAAAGRAVGRGVAQAGKSAAQTVARAGKAVGNQAAKAGQAAAEAVAELHHYEVRIPQKSALQKPAVLSQAAAQAELSAPKPMVDESVSHLADRDSLEILTGGGVEVVYYNQTDERWSGTRYGGDSLKGYGCGPTAMSMVVSSLLKTPVDPADMALQCASAGYWCRGSGSYLSIVEGIADAYGLTCTAIPPETLDEDSLMLHLATGDLAVALMTRGHFTRSGHFIVLRGLTLEGDILVADPASRERSLTPWELSLILSELSPSRHDGAPLWLLSAS